jgi:hypothetical protein
MMSTSSVPFKHRTSRQEHVSYYVCTNAKEMCEVKDISPFEIPQSDIESRPSAKMFSF